jgi:3-oxoacyl-[acyl-carrier protein] reductase
MHKSSEPVKFLYFWSMQINLNGKRALVGGATRGIGRACAQMLAEAGASLILLGRNKEALNQVLKTLPSENSQHHQIFVGDQSEPESLRDPLLQLISTSGVIHILINNSGGPSGGPIPGEPAEKFEQVFKQHLVCNHILTQTLLPGMQSESYGRIVNIISTSVKAPLANLGVSNTIRAAVANWAKTLATEIASSGVTVNNVLPGATDTDRLKDIIRAKATKLNVPEEEIRREMLAEVPAGRFADPRETAAAVTFLCSPLAAYITGINVPVDGGRLSCL